MSTNTGIIEIAPLNATLFSGALSNDFLICNQIPASVWIGSGSNAANYLQVGSNVTNTSNLNVKGLATLSNLVMTGSVIGNISASTFTGALVGNATSATSAGACTGNSATATTAASCGGNAATATTALACTGNSLTATTANTALACTGNAATATTALACSGNAASATTAGTCTGNAATATLASTAGTCTGNAATATTAAACLGNAATATSAITCTGNAATATNLASGNPNIIVGNITSIGTHSNSGPILATSVTATTFTGALVGNATSATTAGTCTGNASTATSAGVCTGSALSATTATTALACSGNAATATSALACTGNATTATNLAVGNPNITVGNITSIGTLSNSGPMYATSVTATTFTGGSTVFTYPPINLTSYSTIVEGLPYGNGYYVVSGTSDDSSYGHYIYNAFGDNAWQTGMGLYNTYISDGLYGYNGAQSTVDSATSTAYSGEWVQLQLPLPIVLQSYSFSQGGGGVSQGFPTWCLFGSTNGITWYILSNTTFLATTNQGAYSYYRFVILTENMSYAGFGPGVSQLKFHGAQMSINIGTEGQVGCGVKNPVQQLEVAGNAIISGNISAGNLGMFRNRIINGDMRINQRGVTSLSLPLNVGNTAPWCTYTVDRFMTTNIGTGVCTFTNGVLLNTDTPYQYGLRASFKNTITTAYGTTSGNLQAQGQLIEGNNMQDLNWGQSFGQPITVSFWSRTMGITSLPVTIQNFAQTYSYNANIAVNASAVWQYNTLTIPAPPGGIWDNVFGMRLMIGGINYANAGLATTTGWVNASSIGTTSSTPWITTVGNYVEFTGLQLEKGTIATPFEFRPYAIELQLCQRYYEILLSQSGYNNNYYTSHYASAAGAGASALFAYKVTKRASPTVITTITGLNSGVNTYNSIESLVFFYSAASAGGFGITLSTPVIVMAEL